MLKHECLTVLRIYLHISIMKGNKQKYKEHHHEKCAVFDVGSTQATVCDTQL